MNLNLSVRISAENRSAVAIFIIYEVTFLNLDWKNIYQMTIVIFLSLSRRMLW